MEPGHHTLEQPGHHTLDRLARLTRVVSGLFWALVVGALGLLIVYALAGAFDPTASLAWLAFVLVLIVLSIAHALWRHRAATTHLDARAHKDRERRGF